MPATPLPSAHALPGWYRTLLLAALSLLLAFAVMGELALAWAIFRPYVVLPLTLLGGLALFASLRRALPAPVAPVAPWPALLALGLALASVVVNSRYAAQHFLVDRDPGVYLAHARWLMDHGAVAFPSSRSIFHGLPVTYAGAGFSDHGAEGLLPQFPALQPMIAAAGGWIGGTAVLTKANAVLGGLSILCLHALGTRLVGAWLALVAVVAVAFSLPEVFFARESYSEMLLQVLVFGGVWLAWEGRDADSPWLAAAGGALLGIGVLARVDAFLLLPPLMAYLCLEALRGPRESEDGPRVATLLAMGGGAVALALMGYLHLHDYNSDYISGFRRQIAATWAVTAVTAVVGAAAVVVLRRRPVRWRPPNALALAPAVVLGALALYAALVRPGQEQPIYGEGSAVATFVTSLERAQGLPAAVPRTFWEDSMLWIVWYLGPVGTAAAVLGLGLALGALVLRRPAGIPRSGGAQLFFLVLLTSSVAYIWKPTIDPDHVWAMRRYVPVVLPGLTLAAVWLAGRVWAQRRLPRVAGQLAALALLAAIVAVPVWRLAPAAGVQDMRSLAAKAGASVCPALAPDAVVAVLPGGDAEANLPQAVQAWCGRPTVAASGVSQVPLLASRARSAGARLQVMSATYPGRVAGAAGQPRRVLVARFPMLEQTLRRPPRDSRLRTQEVYLTPP